MDLNRQHTLFASTIDESVGAYNMEVIEAAYRRLEQKHPARVMLPVTAKLLSRIGQDKLQDADACPTPFPSLNHACRGTAGMLGLPRGALTILAASSGMGKSMVAGVIGAHASKTERVGIITLEMPGSEYLTRQIAGTYGIPIVQLEHGKNFKIRTWNAASDEFLRERTHGGIFVNEEHTIRELVDIEKVVTVLVLEYGCRTVILDYVGLVRARGHEPGRETVEVVAARMNELAAELNFTMLMLSQLSRDTKFRRAQTPLKEDLQWSSRLEQDARMVLILDPSRYQMNLHGQKNMARTVLHTAKNRSGPRPDVLIDIDWRTLTVTEAPDQTLEWNRTYRQFGSYQPTGAETDPNGNPVGPDGGSGGDDSDSGLPF